MKRKILFGILALMLGIQVIPLNADTSSIIKEEFGAGSGELSHTGDEWLQRTFYSNYSKMFYSFFGGLMPGWGNDQLFYSFSPDGFTWPQSDRALQPLTAPGIGFTTDGVNEKINFYMTPDGKHIYYVYETRIDDDELSWGKMSINITTGRLVNNVSSIAIMNGQYGGGGAPGAAWGSKSPKSDYSIVVDDLNYVYIGMTTHQNPNLESYMVIKSSAPDLFIFENFGDAWAIKTERIANGGSNPGDDEWSGILFPMRDNGFIEDIGLVYTFGLGGGVQEQHASMYYDNSTGDWIDFTGGIFNDQEGGDWRTRQWDLGWSSDLAVIFKQDESKNIPDRIEVDALFLNFSTRTWGDRTDITGEELGDAGSVDFRPQVSVREGTNAVNFAWSLQGNDTIWERRMYPNGTLEDIRIFQIWFQGNMPGDRFFNDPNANGPSPISWFVFSSLVEQHPGKVGDFVLFNYTMFLEEDGEEEEWEPIYTHISTTLFNPDGSEVTDNWLFEGEVYDLVSVVNNLTSFDVQAYDTVHNITFRFNNATEQRWIEISPADQFTAGLIWSNFTRDGEQTTIRWRFILDRSIVDSVNQTWRFFMENSFYGEGIWGSPGIVTNIYNLGGFTYYTFTGDGTRVTGGQPFELQATDGTAGSSARAEQYYRKLQSVHFLLEIDMDNEWEGNAFDIDPGVGYVDIGIDYRQNGSWTEWSRVRIYVQSANVGHHDAGNDHNWIEWSIDWYNFLPGPNTSQNIRSDLITSNHWGYENENLSPDFHNRTSSQLWIDLWFDRTNASTTIGGQVNSMFHGMREHGSAWWFGYGVFQPMIADYGNAMFLDDLYDYTGNVTGSINYDLMRFYIEVAKLPDADGDDETWTIRAIENLNRKQADDRMQGVEIPSFEPTLVLDMPMFQSNNPLIRAIDGLSRSIWLGALGFIKILWGAMDTIFEWAGFGAGFFSTLSRFVIETIPSLVLVIMQDLTVLVISFVDIIESVFNLLVIVVPTYVIGLGWLAETLIDYWRAFNDIFSGGIVDWNIIEDLNLGEWVSFGVTMLPFYEIWTIIWSKDVSGKLKERLEFYSALFGGLLSFLRGMVIFMGELVQSIRSFLPI